MDDRRTDGELVIAHTRGDPGALAAIYDRYADRLYDTAAAMLGDRHEAADAMQDVFLTAAEKLGQLREPDRLGPWLFAVLRHVVYRRTAKRGRHQLVDTTAGTSVMADLASRPDPRADGATVSAAELAAEVRAAAAGLDARDQLVLELSVRQGLTGADLADALGVTPAQCHVLVHRMRERVERSLGALTVARMGRRDCADLADLLRDWDGRFDVLVRKRVARHVERCETCTTASRRYAVIPLLGASPALAAPPELRDLVLSRVRAETGTPVRLDRRGFPSLARRSRRAATVAAAVLLVLAVGATVTAVVAGGDDRTVTTRAGEPSPDDLAVDGPVDAARDGAAPPSGVAGDAGSDGAGSDGASTIPASTIPATTTPIATSTASTASPTTASTAPPTTAPPTNSPTTLAPVATTVPSAPPVPPPPAPTTTLAPTATPLATTTVPTTTVPPAPPPPPPPSDTVPPAVSIVRAVTSLACPWTADPTIAARVVDASPISGVTLSWRLSRFLGRGSAPMTEMAPGEWRGAAGIGRVNGTWTFTVTAIDVAGNSGTASGTIVVTGC